MPNRIIKESICVSEDIDRLTWFEEVLFYRLLVNCDDYGRFDGRITIIKNRLFPLKDTITRKNIENAINKLARVGLVCLYEIYGKPFLFLPTWNEHQSVRAKTSKYPEPPEIICKQMISNDFNCKQVQSNDFKRKQMQSNDFKCKQMSPYSYSNSYSYSYSRERNAPAHVCEENTNAEKKAYGEFCNVMLTDKERAQLSEKYGSTSEVLINKFSAKLKSKGYKFADHYATIVLWESEDKQASSATDQKHAEIEDWFEQRLKQTFGEET